VTMSRHQTKNANIAAMLARLTPPPDRDPPAPRPRIRPSPPAPVQPVAKPAAPMDHPQEKTAPAPSRSAWRDVYIRAVREAGATLDHGMPGLAPTSLENFPRSPDDDAAAVAGLFATHNAMERATPNPPDRSRPDDGAGSGCAARHRGRKGPSPGS